MSDPKPEAPVRLGYMLARVDVDLPWLPGTCYRGVDREPFVPESYVMDLIDHRDTAEFRALHPYFEAWEDGMLRRDIAVADEHQGRLQAFGVATEVIWAEAVVVRRHWAPTADRPVAINRANALRYMDRCAAGVGVVDAEFEAIGFDVSPPTPSFHSAIYQPGPGGDKDEFRESINGAGLISRQEVAVELMERANVPWDGVRNFAVIRVFARQTPPP
jgi:hypothetical protein